MKRVCARTSAASGCKQSSLRIRRATRYTSQCFCVRVARVWCGRLGLPGVMGVARASAAEPACEATRRVPLARAPNTSPGRRHVDQTPTEKVQSSRRLAEGLLRARGANRGVQRWLMA